MEVLYGLGAILFYTYFLSYILMGFIQPIGAICRLLGEQRKDSNYAIGLKKYLLSVTTYFIILSFMVQVEPINHLRYFVLFYLLLLPWTFAIWYIRHIRKWKQKKKNIIAFDQMQLLNAPHPDRITLESYPTKKVKIPQKLNGKISAYLRETNTQKQYLEFS